MEQPARRTRVPDRGISQSSLAVFGAPLDTGNLGVSALGLSTLAAIIRRDPGARLVVFDNGSDIRTSRLDLGGVSASVEFRGAWLSRRIYRGESLWTMYGASAVGGSRLNKNLLAINQAAVLDISGGDSFSDLYGTRRFRMTTLPKQISLRCSRPLLLLPQTYGPFGTRKARNSARDIIRRSAGAWARDSASYDQLREVLGDDFDASRHRRGVDVAFALPGVEPQEGGRSEQLRAWLNSGQPPVVGINVSGLLYNAPQEAIGMFGLACDYRLAIQRLAEELLRSTDHRILLIPHVRGTMQESDDRACDELAARLARPDRVARLSSSLDAMGTKWVISRMDWFVGARMHATIAALSSQVPTAGIAYSGKMRGVFATCGVADSVHDARDLSTTGLADSLLEAFHRREDVRATLARRAPATVSAADRQFDEVLGRVNAELP